jgi:PIF1-like helicase/DNA helicase Pif1-like protein
MALRNTFLTTLKYSRFTINVMDRLFQDICSVLLPFGGVTVVFGGDFHQTLPIVINGTHKDTVQATLQHSYLWNCIEVLHLHQNMRISSDTERETFSQWLLNVRHGQTSNDKTVSNYVPILKHMYCSTENKLIHSVYTLLQYQEQMPVLEFFKERAILAAQNKDVYTLNTTILSQMPGEEHMYTSADTYSIETPSDQQLSNLPLEFLHSLNTSGLPIANLHLKLGCPVIILQNIDPRRGLCNGTRATIKNMLNCILEVCIIGGNHDGETTLIPQITLTPSITGLDFAIKLNRRQFPIQLVFMMTINKSQGQSIKQVGIDLCKPIFSHGQLYIVFSHAISS